MTIAFYFKKIIGHALMPLPLILLLLVVGLLRWRGWNRPRLSRWLMSIAVIALVLFSYKSTPRWLAGHLERQYAPLAQPQQHDSIQWVVVLAGDAGPTDSQRPALARLGPATLARLAEGVRLMHAWPQARMVVTGGSGLAGISPLAPVMRHAAIELGVAADRIRVEDLSRDTGEHPIRVTPIIGKEPFALVTSADHMPRAMMLFRRQGLHPVAAPADFASGGPTRWRVLDIFPDSANLTTTQRVWHEYLGIIWENIRRKWQPD